MGRMIDDGASGCVLCLVRPCRELANRSKTKCAFNDEFWSILWKTIATGLSDRLYWELNPFLTWHPFDTTGNDNEKDGVEEFDLSFAINAWTTPFNRHLTTVRDGASTSFTDTRRPAVNWVQLQFEYHQRDGLTWKASFLPLFPSLIFAATYDHHTLFRIFLPSVQRWIFILRRRFKRTTRIPMWRPSCRRLD